MSLVNLSHVCSHLQNASLARLGLTSIPYTRLHLSLSLLLQKQGFLSQVKLGGPSPPASCFPPGTGIRDNARKTGHEGSLLSPESALQRMVAGGVSEEGLRREGLGREAVEFALREREKGREELEQEGWGDVVADFLMRHEGKSSEELEAAGLDTNAVAIAEEHAPLLAEARQWVQKWYSPSAISERNAAIPEQNKQLPHAAQRPLFQPLSETQKNAKVRDYLLRTGFSAPLLRHFAGPTNTLRSERDIHRTGISLSSMGLSIPGIPYQPPPPPTESDPWGLEAEGVVTQANRASRRLWLGLKYWDGLPVLRKARMLSKPTKRIWLTSQELGRLTRGFAAAKGEVKPLREVGEVVVVSTDRGVMEVREAVERRVGGMVLCRVW